MAMLLLIKALVAFIELLNLIQQARKSACNLLKEGRGDHAILFDVESKQY